jgi:hypothetical protein
MREILCSKCKEKFECSGDKECWCAKLDYLPNIRWYGYEDCLCPVCLKEIADETSKNNNQG